MKTAILSLCALTLSAQTLTLTAPSPSVMQGMATTVTVTLAGASGANLTGLEWSLNSTGAIGTPVISAAANAAGKGIQCAAPTCVLIGLNAANVLSDNALTDGAMASYPLTVPLATPLGPLPLSLTSVLGVNASQLAAPVTAGAPAGILVVSRCDANGDGKTDINDVQAVVNAMLGKASCTLPNGACTLGTLEAVLQAALGTKACTL